MIIQIKQIVPHSVVEQVISLLDPDDFADGKATAGDTAQGVKRNRQLGPNTKTGKEAGTLIAKAIQSNRTFVDAAHPKTMLSPVFSLYEPGMTYGEHIDNALMGGFSPIRVDLSAVVFLNESQTYEGGELVISSDYGDRPTKGDAGDLVLFPSTLPHHINPVTKGRRIVALIWLQSMVRDPERRRILFDLANVLRDTCDGFRTSDRGKVLQRCQSNLLRGWIEV